MNEPKQKKGAKDKGKWNQECAQPCRLKARGGKKESSIRGTPYSAVDKLDDIILALSHDVW